MRTISNGLSFLMASGIFYYVVDFRRPGFKVLQALPAKWISKDAMKPCMVSVLGSGKVTIILLYPRNEEVAVVRCAALARHDVVV